MKKLFLLFLFVPILSYGQKPEFTEMGGIGLGDSPGWGGNLIDLDGGYINRFSAVYYFVPHFSLGALYEFNSWDEHFSSLGAVADFQFKHVYIGLDIGYLKVGTTVVQNYGSASDVATYDPALMFDVHFGLRQKLARRFYLKEQMGFYQSHVNSTVDNETPYNKHFGYTNLLVGLAYRFTVRKAYYTD